jgi:ABC-2 type transport system permease protein
MNGSLRRIGAIIYRHVCLYRRSWPRVAELAYWPVLQLCVWGFTSRFLAGRPIDGIGFIAGTLIGGVLLWEFAVRSQMGVAIGFLEEIWSRNLGHLFVSPIRPWELVAGLLAVSTLRVAASLVPAVLVAWLLYRFDLLTLGPVLGLFIANLMFMGWWVAIGVVSLILRHGQGAEALAWSVLFGLTPFSAVFYPVSTLPAAVRPIAWALPSSHVFEGMRAVLGSGVIRWDHLAAAILLNALWAVAAVAVFSRQFARARSRGALISIGE